MSWQYGFIRSWHVIRSATRIEGQYLTLCGRLVNGDILDELRLSEKSCERCLQIKTGLEQKMS